jgi:hypothetical protein
MATFIINTVRIENSPRGLLPLSPSKLPSMIDEDS